VTRLHRRIYLHFLGVLLVVGVAISLVFALGARDAFPPEVAERMARHVSSLVAERLDDGAGLGARLAQLRADLEIDLTVRDLDGRLLAAAGPELAAPAPSDAADVRAGHLVLRPRPRWYAATLVRDPASAAPRAILTASAPHRRHFSRLVWPATAVAVVLLVAGVATIPLARRLARPIERLTDAARELGQGDLSRRAPAPASRRRRGDELTQLTDAFNEMAERVERLVHGERELLANVSHELRSPLARIRMALALLPRDVDSGARVEALERDLDELDGLIEDVLTTARLDASGLPIELAPVDVGALLAELAERARTDPIVAGRALVAAAVPALSIVADRGLLRRALWNLIENAAKYGAPPITLNAGRVAGDLVEISVTDRGEGIPAGDRERVFAAFYRADRARTPTGAPRGVGLGLTLARRVAEVHGGTIRIEPAEVDVGRERGCRVVVTLPSSPR
jgi:signal transduction histidine kinase